jgi:hypothetical protein
MKKDPSSTCRFEAVEPGGMLLFEINGERVRATLEGARIPPSKAAEANAFLADRAPRVRLRCTICDRGPPAIVHVDMLAWRDKSGDVWQDLGAALVEQGYAVTTADQR